MLWDDDGAPVSMAMLRAPAAGVSRIGPVFTPRTGVAAATARPSPPRPRIWRAASGTADVVLFADLANPTSNAIYQRIGFEAVVDSVRIDFVTLAERDRPRNVPYRHGVDACAQTLVVPLLDARSLAVVGGRVP